MLDRVAYTIAIVGSGFSGTAAAIHLLRQKPGRRSRLLLIERAADFGRGVAYAKTRYPYLLNVPASRMSATASDPDDFLRFVRRENAEISGEDFLPRARYGDYLLHLLDTAVAEAAGDWSLERVRAEVIDLAAREAGDPIILTFSDGTQVGADAVVLALGAPATRLPAAIRCTASWPIVRQDPWRETGSPKARGALLVIGTGLTMVDVVCAATADDPGVVIHAISRHGLLPHGQTEFRPDAHADDGGLLTRSGRSTLPQMVTAVRSLAEQAERAGGDWREVIALVRRDAPALWGGLSPAERARFLRHVRAYWEVHRHRMPAPVLARMDALRATRRLHVHAGRLVSIEAMNDGVLATWIARGSERRQTLHAAEVVNCTGAHYDVTHSTEPLWRALLARGLAVPDELRLGVRTGTSGALIGRDGLTSQRLFYVGPMLRADHWEATAVGELRAHVQRLAQHLLTSDRNA